MNEDELSKALSTLIFVYRHKNRITLEKLSTMVDLDTNFLSKLERGKHTTLLTNYFKIMKAVKIPIDEFTKYVSMYLRN